MKTRIMSLFLIGTLLVGCGVSGTVTPSGSHSESENISSNIESGTSEVESVIPSESETESSEPSETESQLPSESETQVPTESEQSSETPGPGESEKPADYGVIPTGCTYTSGKTVLKAGDKFPSAPKKGDKYETEEYIYEYKYRYTDENDFYDDVKVTINGWNVTAKDDTKTTYGQILSNIAGKPVTGMCDTFSGCDALVTVPQIPDTITDMYMTFAGCDALVDMPQIPYGVKSMIGTFRNCPRLENFTDIPDSVTNMRECFIWCLSMKEAPKLPEKLENMQQTFYLCYYLETAPEIPETVINMTEAFGDCKRLKKMTRIPKKVEYIEWTFRDCYSLTGTIVIDANPILYERCFEGVNFKSQGITLSGTASNLSSIESTQSYGLLRVPEGGSFYCAETQQWYNEGQKMPFSIISQGDKLSLDGYLYEFGIVQYNGETYTLDGWNVRYTSNHGVNDFGATVPPVYNPIKEELFDWKVKGMAFCFINAPFTECPIDIPENMEYLYKTFYNCKNLEVAPTIPENVREIECCFQNCTSLVETPYLGKNVKFVKSAFEGCSSLTKIVNFPENVEEPVLGCFDYTRMFKDCISLVEVPEMPESSVVLDYTFEGCTSLEVAPTIPIKVQFARYTFKGCTSLKVAPLFETQEMAVDINGIFQGCTSLEVVESLPSSTRNMDYVFADCINLKTAPVIPRSVQSIYKLFANCTSLTGEVAIDCDIDDSRRYGGCFENVDLIAQNITLCGKSNFLNKYKSTSLNPQF